MADEDDAEAAESNKYDKLKNWVNVKRDIEDILLGEEPVDNDISLRSGLEVLDTLHHPQPIKCFTLLKGKADNFYITQHSIGVTNQVNVWAVDKTSYQIKREKINTKADIAQLTYIAKHRIFAAYCRDMTMRIFSDISHGFKQVSVTPCLYSIMCMVYNKDTDELLAGGAGCLLRYSLEQFRRRLKELEPYNVKIYKFEMIHLLKLSHKAKHILMQSDFAIHVYNYDTKRQLHRLPNTHDWSLSCLSFYWPSDYFITASRDGVMKIWNSTVFRMMHQFTGHSSGITDMVVHHREPLLFSSSTDGTIRVWRLDTFEVQQRLDVGERILGMKWANNDELVYWTENEIKIARLNMFYSLFTIIHSSVNSITRTRFSDGPCRIVVCTDDCSIHIISPVTGADLTIVYPLPSSKMFRDALYNTYEKRLYALLEKEVLVYDCTSNPCKPEMTIRATHHDKHVLCIADIRLDDALGISSGSNEILIFAGHVDGSISLIHSNRVHMSHEVQGHQSPVTRLTISTPDKDIDLPMLSWSARLISAGPDGHIGGWEVIQSTADDTEIYLKRLFKVKVYGPANHVCMMADVLCYSLENQGAVEMLQFADRNEENNNSNHNVSHVVLPHSSDDNHTRPVNGMSGCQALGLFATSGDDASVKVWDKSNQLIRELVFDGPLQGVIFANNRGDLLVGFHGHIYATRITQYLPFDYLAEILFKQFQDDVKEVPIPFNHAQERIDYTTIPHYPLEPRLRREQIEKDELEKAEQQKLEVEHIKQIQSQIEHIESMLFVEREKVSHPKTGKLQIRQVKSEVGVLQLDREKSEIGELQIEPQRVDSKPQEHIEEVKLVETPETTSKTKLEGKVDISGDQQSEPQGEGEVLEPVLADDIVDTPDNKPISALDIVDIPDNKPISALDIVDTPKNKSISALDIVDTTDMKPVSSLDEMDAEKSKEQIDENTEEEVTQAKKEELERVLKELKALDKKRKYPIAPDGYIPNSVIRKLYKIEQPDIVMKKTPWKLKTFPKRKTKKDVLEGDELSDASESYEPFYFDDSEEEKLIFSSTDEEKEEEERVTPTDAAAATVDKSGRPKVVKTKKKKPPEIPQTDFDQWSRPDRKGMKTELGGKARDSSILEGEQGELGEKKKGAVDPILQEIAGQSWFPPRNPPTVAGVAGAFANLLHRVDAPVFHEICDYIIQVHQKIGFPSNNMDNLVRKLTMQLKNVDAAIRAFATKTLGKLGVVRDDILLALLPALADVDDEVRFVTAEALKLLANVQNKDDLMALMEKLGALQDTKSKDNEDEAMISLSTSESSVPAIGDMVLNWIDMTAGGDQSADKRDDMDKGVSSDATKRRRAKGRKPSDAKPIKEKSIKAKGQDRGTAKLSSDMEEKRGRRMTSVEEQKSQTARPSVHDESWSKDRMHESPMEDELYDYRTVADRKTSRRRSKLLPYNADLFKMYRKKTNIPGSVDSGAVIKDEEVSTIPSSKIDAYEMQRRLAARQEDLGLGTDIDLDLMEAGSSVQYMSLKHDEDSGVGHTSDDASSYLGKPGYSLVERGMPVLSPVKSAEDVTVPENWRKFLDTPSAQHRRILAESEQQRETLKDGGHILPPIRYIDSKTEMVPGEPGMRLLRAITLAENMDEGARRLQIESVPAKLGIDTTPQDSGLSRFGILNMQWTTDIPRPGYSESRSGSRIRRPQLFMSKTDFEPKDKGHIFSSGLKPFPIEVYPSSDHFFPDLSRSKTSAKNATLYAWEKPIPPPPNRPHADSLPRKVPVHSCDYSKLLKKRMHEHCSQPGKRSFLPSIGASVADQHTEESGQGCLPSDDLLSRSDISPTSNAFLSNTLPPMTLKMLVVKF